MATICICLAYASVKSKATRLSEDSLTNNLLFVVLETGIIAMALKSGWIGFNPFVSISMIFFAMLNYYHSPDYQGSNDNSNIDHYMYVYMIFPFIGALIAGIIHLIIQKVANGDEDDMKKSGAEALMTDS